MSLDRFKMSEEQKRAQTQSNKKEFDNRFWKPAIRTPNMGTNSQLPVEYVALIRILPRGLDFSKSFAVMTLDHFFRQNNQFFSAVCRKTLGPKEFCPICEYAWGLFNKGKTGGDEVLKKMGKDRLPTTHYTCNVLILKDKVKSENDGKVKIWKMTEPMYKIIEAASMEKPVSDPKEEDDDLASSGEEKPLEPFHPYDPVEGRHLVMKLMPHPKTKFPSYEGSKWYKPELGLIPIANTEKEIEDILSQCNDLSEFTANIKSVEALQADLLEFEARVNNNFNANQQQQPVIAPPASVDAMATIAKPVVGNPSDFWGNLPSENVVVPSATAQAPKMEPVVSQNTTPPTQTSTPSMPDDDDDLPF